MIKLKIYILLLLITVNGCSLRHREDGSQDCNSGYILIAYIGQVTTIRYPLLIRTDIKDSSYLRYIGRTKEQFSENGFIIPPRIFEGDGPGTNAKIQLIVSKTTFQILKDYIKKHDTKINTALSGGEDENTQIVILSSLCDSLKYTVNKSNSSYFSKLIDTVQLLGNKDLIKSLTYCKWTQGVE